MQSISQVPEQLQLFTEYLPRKPYATLELSSGLKICKQGTALRMPYIQANPHNVLRWLIFDVDQKYAAVSWDDNNLPVPAWVCQNPSNGHAHIAYGLTAPVCKSPNGRAAPIRYAAAIQEGFRQALGADPGYSGLITKNPLSANWRTWTPVPGAGMYELGYLAEFVPLSNQQRTQPIGLGRNCTLFDDLRVWAYKQVRQCKSFDSFQRQVHSQVAYLNSYTQPLPHNEVRAIAKSVTKWVWQKMDRESFSATQAARGSRKGAGLRQQGLALLAAGQTVQEVVKALGVNRATAFRWQAMQCENRQLELPL